MMMAVWWLVACWWGSAAVLCEPGCWPMTSRVADDLRHPVLIFRAIPLITIGSAFWPRSKEMAS
jgi:hypothetical protein